MSALSSRKPYLGESDTDERAQKQVFFKYNVPQQKYVQRYRIFNGLLKGKILKTKNKNY